MRKDVTPLSEKLCYCLIWSYSNYFPRIFIGVVHFNIVYIRHPALFSSKQIDILIYKTCWHIWFFLRHWANDSPLIIYNRVLFTVVKPVKDIITSKDIDFQLIEVQDDGEGIPPLVHVLLHDDLIALTFVLPCKFLTLFV